MAVEALRHPTAARGRTLRCLSWHVMAQAIAPPVDLLGGASQILGLVYKPQ